MLSWIAENFDRGTHAVIALVLCVQYSVAEHGRQMEAILTMRLRQGAETLKAPEATLEYEVLGLPTGHETTIALFDDHWKITQQQWN
jgi:glutamine amidotransferase PdxT